MSNATRLLALLLALLAVPALARAEPVETAENAARPLTVVELFTSQGCSSCPPADAYLGELAQRDGILALSMHVDYWDYIGWVDPFASPAHTSRQRDYARQFRLRYVYTPQIVVNGAHQAKGGDRRAVEAALNRTDGAPQLDIRLMGGPQRLSILLPGGNPDGVAWVWLAAFDREHTTWVGGGENSGRSITNFNVVRSLRSIGVWRGRPVTLTTAIGGPGADSCAVIVQSRRTGRILGAARMDLDAGR